MAFSFKSLNKTNVFNFHPDETATYVKLQDLLEANNGDIEAVYTVRALYINNKSKFGEQCVAALDDVLVNLPVHKLEDVKAIIATPEAVDQINAGECGFQIRSYVDGNGINRLTIDWVDIK